MRNHFTATPGFTLTELMTVMVVIGVLVGLAFPIASSYRYKGPDAERQSDTESIARAFEVIYRRSTGGNGPSYPTTVQATDPSGYGTVFNGQDLAITKAPGATSTTSITAATSTSTNQTPTATQYIYQPFTASNALCTTTSTPCVRFTIYYLNQENNRVMTAESLFQQ